jgi:hypothetical protein
MAKLTPSQLLVEYTEHTLTQLAQFVVVQPDGSRYISLEDLQAQLLIATQDFDMVGNILESIWHTPIGEIEASLATLAANPHTHPNTAAGLSNVANIAKEDLPISTAQQAALDTKVDADVTIAPTITTPQPREW